MADESNVLTCVCIILASLKSFPRLHAVIERLGVTARVMLFLSVTAAMEVHNHLVEFWWW
jgi:hypothetical protein